MLLDSSLILHLVPVSDLQPFCINGEGEQREASFRSLGVSMDLQGSSDNPQENCLIVFCHWSNKSLNIRGTKEGSRVSNTPITSNPPTPPQSPSCPLAGRFRVSRSQTSLIHIRSFYRTVSAADQSCGVNSVSSTSCFSCLFVGVLQHNGINLLLFSKCCAGVGASGSCSALVSVGQKLCKAGGIRQRIGSCSTCSEGLNTDFQMKSLLQCCVLFTCVPDVRELLSYKHFHRNVAFPGLKMLNVGFLLWCMSAESHHILKHRSQFLKD